jgi:hypothetical protein
LPLELEGVIASGDGQSMGCCVARIKQEIDLQTCQYIKSAQSTNGEMTIQPNDLLISLNSISILSRPHSTILSLLQQFESHPKTIVFRSLDKVWKSQFEERTMRNVKSGKRVSTAMDVESMERELWSWVETPTKALDGRVEEAVRRRMAKKAEREKAGWKDEGVSASLSTPIKAKSVELFSPSNVRKISRTTPTPLKSLDANRAHDASTAKKKNVRKKSVETPGKKQMKQIGQVLVGKDAENEGFERMLRLKKEVLNELHSVRLALIEETKSDKVDPKSVTAQEEPTAVSRESLLNQAKQLKKSLRSDGQFIERFVDMQIEIRQETAK